MEQLMTVMPLNCNTAEEGVQAGPIKQKPFAFESSLVVPCKTLIQKVLKRQYSLVQHPSSFHYVATKRVP